MRQRTTEIIILIVAVAMLSSVGCQSYTYRGETYAASSVRNASCCNEIQPQKINFLTLRRSPPEEYIIGPGDTLGVYVQGITGDKDTPPPVHFPEDSSMQPALGYPVPIRDDGYISLPLVPPVRLKGMTLGQAEARIREAYTKDRKILLEGNDKIIVTMMKRRTYNVLVIREDVSDKRTFSLRANETFIDDTNSGQTTSIDLPAYENDVLHALSETGGMPTENAKNEIVVIRGAMNDPQFNQGGIIEAIGSQPQANMESPYLNGANIVRIPIESRPGEMMPLSEADITLEDGDVVYIEGRQRDVFYTGGLLEGGRFPLPRDYEIDVLEAISLAGGSVSTAAGSSGGNSLRGGGILPATRVTIMRKSGCEQCAIEVDLRYALGDASERVIIQPGDLIMLEYRPKELLINSAVQIFQFGGIFRLLD
jgi:protein involved in polysaccharide export with SLBB domain